MNIKYPEYKYDASPTPLNELFICPKCGYAKWSTMSPYMEYCIQCRSPKQNNVRMRKATDKEKKEALKVLADNKERFM